MPWLIWAIFLLLLIFFSIDFYNKKGDYPPTIDEFLNNPQKYEGRITEFTGPVASTSSDSFVMVINQKSLKIYYTLYEKPKLGQIYSLVRLNADGTSNAIKIHELSYNYIKYAVSFIALIIFLYIFFRDWKFKKWRFVENA